MIVFKELKKANEAFNKLYDLTSDLQSEIPDVEFQIKEAVKAIENLEILKDEEVTAKETSDKIDEFIKGL